MKTVNILKISFIYYIYIYILNLRLGKNKWESVLILRLVSRGLWHHAVTHIMYLQIRLETDCVHINCVFLGCGDYLIMWMTKAIFLLPLDKVNFMQWLDPCNIWKLYKIVVQVHCHLGDRSGAYKVLVGRPEERRSCGKPRHRWKDDIKMVP